MVVGAKVCELTDGFLWLVCGNFDVSPKSQGYGQGQGQTKWPPFQDVNMGGLTGSHKRPLNPIDPNPAISAVQHFRNPAISARKNGRFSKNFHIFQNRTSKKV